jgi:hypothetical protein
MALQISAAQGLLFFEFMILASLVATFYEESPRREAGQLMRAPASYQGLFSG